jgi:hypothetical protein
LDFGVEASDSPSPWNDLDREKHAMVRARCAGDLSDEEFTVAGLAEAQADYATWLDSLPDRLRDSAIAEALGAICDLDPSELQAIGPQRGFGRD